MVLLVCWFRFERNDSASCCVGTSWRGRLCCRVKASERRAMDPRGHNDFADFFRPISRVNFQIRFMVGLFLGRDLLFRVAKVVILRLVIGWTDQLRTKLPLRNWRHFLFKCLGLCGFCTVGFSTSSVRCLISCFSVPDKRAQLGQL